MKNLILILAMMISGQAFAEDSVVCEMGDERFIDVATGDDGFLAVSSDVSMDLMYAEVQYLGSSVYQNINIENTRLRDEETIVSIRLTFDQGTSVRQVYTFPWSKFGDGEEMKVKHEAIGVTGKVMRKHIIKCMAAQS